LHGAAGIVLFPCSQTILVQISEKNTGVIARFKYEFGEQDDELRTVQAEKRLLRLYRGAVENGAHLFPSGLTNIIALEQQRRETLNWGAPI
jgi:hypothetical protein